MLPGKMQAIIAHPPGAPTLETTSVPSLRDDSLLVRVRAVALNPTDWKHAYQLLSAPAKLGCDYAGDVVAVSADCSKAFAVGDRVCGVVHGGNSSRPVDDGAFGEYLVARAGVQMRIPDDVSYEEAATLGVGIVTIGQGLYQTMRLPWPEDVEEGQRGAGRWILVYGGSTATGALAIQWARLSGCKVITTCSPRNFAYVKSLGAAHVLDYNSPDVGAQIRALTNNELYLAYDTIDEQGSAAICGAALSSRANTAADGGSTQPLFVGILADKCPRDDVRSVNTMGYTVMGEEFTKFGHTFEAKPEDYEFTVDMTNRAEKYLSQGLFRPHRLDARDGGLKGVLGGLEDLKSGKVSGVKLAYRVP